MEADSDPTYDEDDECPPLCPMEWDDITTFVADDMGCVDACLEKERILEAAGFHVCQAEWMRHYIQHAMQCTK
jgi:hypothetical protein